MQDNNDAAAYGGIWLSVCGQHPYTGPSGWAIAVAYLAVFLVIGASAAALKRAGAGVGGTSLVSAGITMRLQRA